MKKVILALLISPLGLFANENVTSFTQEENCSWSHTGVITCENGNGSTYTTSCHDNIYSMVDEIFDLMDAVCNSQP